MVFGAVVGGYLMEHGNIKVLLQPAELVIIAGAAAGTILIANPPGGAEGHRGRLQAVFGGSKFGKTALPGHAEATVRGDASGAQARAERTGNDVENPAKSKLF